MGVDIVVKFEEAVVLATNAHNGQKRKGDNNPYIIHPIIVGMTLLDQGCSEAVVIAGILHDTVEDTKITLEDIEDKFGHKIKRIVKGVSEPDRTLPWRDRKRHTIEYIKKASVDERMVICADKLHNINSMIEQYLVKGDSLWEVFNGDKGEQIWYYRGLLDSLECHDDLPEKFKLLDDLSASIENFIQLVN